MTPASQFGRHGRGMWRALGTHKLACMLSWGFVASGFAPSAVSAQKNDPNSTRILYVIKACNVGLWDVGWFFNSYGGGNFATNWRLLYNAGTNPVRGTYKAESAIRDTLPSLSQNGPPKLWITPRQELTCWDERWYNLATEVTYYYTDYTSRVFSGTVIDRIPPKPRFEMDTESQESGDGGTLTISAGHSLSLSATTTEFGSPAASDESHVWWNGQNQIGTGSNKTFTPGDGTHDISVSLGNGWDSDNVHATVVVVPPDEAGSCDDPMTDVVETNCDGEEDHGIYGVGSESIGGTEYCWVLDWYDWNPSTQSYEYWYTEQVYCWYEQ